MNDFLTFRKLITPTIIQVIFWIGVAVCVLGGLVAIVQGAGGHQGTGPQVLRGVLLMILGPLAVRIYCELLIIMFRIHDRLTEISNNTGSKQSGVQSV